MSAPVFLVDALPPDDTALLAGSEGRHAATVRRVQPGERVDLADGAGSLAVCTVTGVGRDEVRLSVVRREHVAREVPRLVVVQALAKGDRGELAVELMTEAGVDVVVPWAAERSVAQWRGERGERALVRWRSTARAAAKQSRRVWLPDVEPLHSTEQVAGRLATASTALVLHEEAELSLSIVDLRKAGEVVVVVGPEGGIVAAELAAFERAGGLAVRLGRTVLRTSTAGVAALSVLSARLGRW